MACLRSFFRWKALNQFSLGLVFTLLPCILAIIEKTTEEIERRLKDHDIVPDIIEDSAHCELQIKYVYGYIPNFGNDINPNSLQGPPFLVRFQRDSDEYFTLLMIDPDQPSRSGPEEREWIHWLVVNMEGCSVMSGQTIVKYLTPKPEKGTGPHRYIFLVFKQRNGPQDFSDEKVIKEKEYNATVRGKWSTKAFVKRHFLGKPWAATFFYSEYKPRRSYDGKKRGKWSTKDFIKRHNLGKPWAVNFFVSEYKPPPLGTTTIPPEFDFTYQTIHADVLTGDIDYADLTTRKK